MLKLSFLGLQSVMKMNITYNVKVFPDHLARCIDGRLHPLPIIGCDEQKRRKW